MEKTIYIHIGSPKTGTTSIQQFLTINHNTLLEDGLFYPIVGRQCITNQSCTNQNYHEQPYPIFANGNILTNSNYDGRCLKKILKEFSKNDSVSMLLSEELLFTEYKNNIYDKLGALGLLTRHNLKVIVYLKRSVEYLSGLWQEELRNKSTINLETYLETHPYPECLNIIHKLSSKIGVNNMIVKTFEKERWQNSDLIDDFLSIFKINNHKKFYNLKNVSNAGLTRERNEKFRYINTYLDISIENNDYNINQKIPDDKDSQKIIDSLSDSVIKKVSDKHYSHECNISKKFLGRNELFINKYPNIYGKKRIAYSNKITEKDIRCLQFTISSIIQTQIINNQKILISLQDPSLRKISKANYIIRCKKLLVLLLCIFVPFKKYRKNIRSYLS